MGAVGLRASLLLLPVGSQLFAAVDAPAGEREQQFVVSPGSQTDGFAAHRDVKPILATFSTCTHAYWSVLRK